MGRHTAEARRAESYSAMQRGEVVIERLERGTGECNSVSGGLIHHWVGALWIPGATLAQTLALVQAYDRTSRFNSPFELRIQILEHQVRLQGFDSLSPQEVITVVLDTVFSNRLYTSMRSCLEPRPQQSVREIKNHDTQVNSFPEGEAEATCGACPLTGVRGTRRAALTCSRIDFSHDPGSAGLTWLIEAIHQKRSPRIARRDLKDTRKGVLHPPKLN